MLLFELQVRVPGARGRFDGLFDEKMKKIYFQQNIFKFVMLLEEETWQKLEISSEKTKRKGKFPSLRSEIIGNCAFPLCFHGENSHEILIFFAVVTP